MSPAKGGGKILQKSEGGKETVALISDAILQSKRH